MSPCWFIFPPFYSALPISRRWWWYQRRWVAESTSTRCPWHCQVPGEWWGMSEMWKSGVLGFHQVRPVSTMCPSQCGHSQQWTRSTTSFRTWGKFGKDVGWSFKKWGWGSCFWDSSKDGNSTSWRIVTRPTADLRTHGTRAGTDGCHGTARDVRISPKTWGWRGRAWTSHTSFKATFGKSRPKNCLATTCNALQFLYDTTGGAQACGCPASLCVFLGP